MSLRFISPSFARTLRRLTRGTRTLQYAIISILTEVLDSNTRAFASRSAPLGQSSSIKNPRSSNSESQSINISRGTKERHDSTPDKNSVQSPISSQFGPTSEKHEGEEPSTTHEMVKNNPNASAEEKRKNVEQAGRTPMGPEDN